MASLIELREVDKVYQTRDGELQALRQISLRVGEGEFITIVGPSGCGKSTLLKLISGLLPLTRGTALANSEPITTPRANIGFVFQTPVLLEWRTILRNVLFPIEMLGWPVRHYVERANELLKLVGLQGFERRYPYELSGGMQQRAAICRALIHDPPLLLMDEPFGALDAITRDEMTMELLRIWSERQKTVIFITHSIPEAVILADRVEVMTARPGRIVASLPIDLERPRTLAQRTTPRYIDYVTRIHQLLGLQ